MIDPDLLTKFQATKFIVCTPRAEIVMRIGERCSELDRLMIESDAVSCAFITAWNPGSVRALETANCAKENQLIQEVRRRGHAFLHGRGVGEGSRWTPEPSILIIGIARQTAKDLGGLFGQTAIVFVDRGKSVELLSCPE
jgi:Protein of unknown function (DUF3293)